MCLCSGSTVHYKVTMEKKGVASAFTLKFTGVQAGRFVKCAIDHLR